MKVRNAQLHYSLSIGRTDQTKQTCSIFSREDHACVRRFCHEPANLGLTISADYNMSEMIS